MNSNNLFNLVKNKKIELFKKTIKNIKNLNLDIKDKNGNYLIHHLINLNNIELMKFILKNYRLRLDILDIEGRNLLYTPIKYNYLDILELILEYDKINIGISAIDRKDLLGFTGLHYTFIFNNIDAMKLLLDNNSDIYILTNDNLTIFEIGFQYKRTNMLLELFKYNINYNFKNIYGQTIIQIALGYDNLEIVNFLLDKDIDFNNKDKEHGYTLLHHIVSFNNNNILEIFNKIIKIKNLDINQIDFLGNNVLHIAINENNTKVIIKLIKMDINYNIQNYFGNIPLHTFLENNEDISNDLNNNNDSDNVIILKKLIEESNLNIQNNEGKTCLHLLIDYYLWDNEEILKILKQKKLNIFIKDNNNDSIYSNILNKTKLINLVSESFYYNIQKYKDKLRIDWQKKCSDQDYKKILETNNKSKCIKKIKDYIVKEKISLPKISNYNIKIDNGIFLNTCYYIGIPIDILFGLLYIKNKHDNVGLVLDFPLTINEELTNSFNKQNIEFEYSLKFSNIGITWYDNKIFYPTYFNSWFKNLEKNKYKFIIIPIGMLSSSTDQSHANIIYYDVKKKIIERFEPNGANPPKGFNYNPNLLDKLLQNKFNQIDNNIKVISPKDYLPQIGLQMYESFENNKCKRLGDPNGFCAVWCTWWIDKKIKYYNIESSVLINELIKKIKLDNLQFKTIIRNYTKNITDLRDNYLQKYNIDINKFYNDDFDIEILDNLEKDILELI